MRYLAAFLGFLFGASILTWPTVQAFYALVVGLPLARRAHMITASVLSLHEALQARSRLIRRYGLGFVVNAALAAGFWWAVLEWTSRSFITGAMWGAGLGALLGFSRIRLAQAEVIETIAAVAAGKA